MLLSRSRYPRTGFSTIAWVSKHGQRRENALSADGYRIKFQCLAVSNVIPCTKLRSVIFTRLNDKAVGGSDKRSQLDV